MAEIFTENETGFLTDEAAERARSFLLGRHMLDLRVKARDVIDMNSMGEEKDGKAETIKVKVYGVTVELSSIIRDVELDAYEEEVFEKLGAIKGSDISPDFPQEFTELLAFMHLRGLVDDPNIRIVAEGEESDSDFDPEEVLKAIQAAVLCDKDNGTKYSVHGSERNYDLSVTDLASLVARGGGHCLPDDIGTCCPAGVADNLIKNVPDLEKLFMGDPREELIAFVSCMKNPQVAS